MATKSKKQKAYTPNSEQAILVSILFIFFASFYNSLWITESFILMFAIFFSPLILVIWFLSYRMGKRVAIYNKYRKKILGKNYKWILVSWMITVVLTILCYAIIWGYPLREGDSYIREVPLHKAILRAMVLAAIPTIPAWISTSRNYNIEVPKKTKAKPAPKKSKKEDFEEL